MFALIPARGGSKGIPKKNIKDLNGKPLIVWTIEAAKKSKYIKKIIVSTDDDEIAKIALNNGADVPFLRPDNLASDNAKAIDNYIYSIPLYEDHYKAKIDEFVVLLPTSPLRLAEDIDKAIELFNNKKAESVISVSEATHPPSWAKIINNDLKITNYFENRKIGNENRQEIQKAYMPNGAIYIFKYSFLKEKYTYYSENSYASIMPQNRSIDIDSIIDFKFTEFLMKEYHEKY